MKRRRISLPVKICAGALLCVSVGSGSILLWSKDRRLHHAESYRQVRYDINTLHHHISVFAVDDDSVHIRTEEDYRMYRECRMQIDTLLRTLREDAVSSVFPGRTDTLRNVLSNKEVLLHHVIRALRPGDTDSLLIVGFSVIVKQAAFPPAPDSLATNRELCRELQALVNSLDEYARTAFPQRKSPASPFDGRFLLAIVGLLCAVVFLAVLLYRAVRHGDPRGSDDRQRLEGIIKQNAELLEIRQKVILSIIHDIRGPLNTINGNAELSMNTRDKRKRNRQLENIRVLCKHILHLLNNLLDMYRLNEAKETRNDVPFRLSALLERIVAGFARSMQDKGLLFSHDFEGTDVIVRGDSDRIEQIIDNLLTNAVKFTEAGIVNFNAVYRNGVLSLEVSDTGIGMSEETLARIFQPFERSASEANASGFGLGLPITKGLVALLDGTISVKSEVGKGSTFLVSLPLPATTDTAEKEPSANTPERLPQRILVIDDDPMQLEVIKEMLVRNGVSCTTCQNMQEVVNEMRRTDYDLLLTDIQMTGINGFDLLALLRRSNVGNSRTIPAIAMTARGEKDRETFMQAGFSECLYKPFSMNELLNILASVLRETESRAAMADFSALTSNVRDKSRMLNMFILESRKDIADLRSAMAAKDRISLRKTVHRMLPMWEILQTDHILSAYRSILHRQDVTEQVIEKQTLSVISFLEGMIGEAESEIEHEKENDTDSGR